jgi:soluble lytic murein transglycosylase-like protein
VTTLGTSLKNAQLDPKAAAAATRFGLDPALVTAVIAAESGRSVEAVSPRGAIGLMQVLPTTAAEVGVPDAASPATNLEAGCRYLSRLLGYFGGDVELALAAYNAGPGAVRRWGGVPPYRETRAFIAKVAENYQEITGMDVTTATRLAVRGEPSL